MSTTRKYRPDNMLPWLRIAAKARKEMLAAGCTDNGGAIHSVERIVNILSERVCYNVTHNQQLKTDPRTEISVAAHAARLRGEKVYIEHVLPHREFAQMVCCKIDEGLPDEGILQFIEDNYRLVLLTEDERRELDRENRTHISPDSLARIPLWKP